MPDYYPPYPPGPRTSRASASITGGRAVCVSGSGTVANTAGPSQIPIGIAATDASENADVSYFGRGAVHDLVASGTVTAGEVVAAAAAGAFATHTQGTNDIRGFAVALTTATTGNTFQAMEL